LDLNNIEMIINSSDCLQNGLL